MTPASCATPLAPLRFGLIPLDDRPCNLEQVQDLARVARIEAVTPPLELLQSHADRPARFERLEEWLETHLGQLDALVLSLDQWIYGGLIQSRQLEFGPAEALRRMQRLGALLERFPGKPVYAFQVLLRLSVTVNAGQSEADWRNIFEYSTLAAEPAPGPEVQLRLRQLRERIPASLLAEYLAARERNHGASLALVNLAPRLRYAVFGQEDCAEQGLHRPEKATLQARIDDLAPEQRARFLILTGADELGAMSLMRALMDHTGVQAGSWQVNVPELEDPALAGVSAYEDIPARENFKLHLEASPFAATPLPASPGRPWTIRILPWGPGGQGDLCFTPPETPSEGSARLQRIRQLTDSMRPGDALVDLSHGNGADPTLVRELARRMPLRELSAFSAWNTTGNRLGTLLAHLAVSEMARRSGRRDAEAHDFYLQSQILDHFAYQAQIRGELIAMAKSRGWNAWALSPDAWLELSERADRKLHAIADELGLPIRFKASLPWPRLFEVSIRPA